MWMCEVQLVLNTECDLLNKDVESFFASQNMYAVEIYIDEFSNNLSVKTVKPFFIGIVYIITGGTKSPL
jgi:hypothetical protein